MLVLPYRLVRMVSVPTRVLKQGRITIPAEAREELGLNPGDYVIVDIRPLNGGRNDE